MAVLITVGPARRIVLSIKKNVGRVHIAREKTDFDLCRYKLHGNIEADLVNRYGGIFPYLTGNTVEKARIKPFTGLRSLGLILRVEI